MSNIYILVTGGLGYIGSHVTVELLKICNVIILDNLANSSLDRLHSIEQILENNSDEQINKSDTNNKLIFIKGDIRNTDLLRDIFTIHNIDCVIHFAALKSVNESQLYPDLYYDVNVNGSKNLFNVMQEYNCKKLIYSSSAAIYGDIESPISEDIILDGKDILCNYGFNKYEIDKYLTEGFKNLFSDWKIIILRYFNPIGAHTSGLLGDDPKGIPSNIFPYILRVAKKVNSNNIIDTYDVYSTMTIFGNNYNTHDGTCIRDFIHINDLANAHIKSYEKIITKEKIVANYCKVYNVGTGNGVSILELIAHMNQVLNDKGLSQVNYVIGPRRDGDIVSAYANSDKIKNELGFVCNHSIYDMCYDGLKFIGL